MTIHIFQMSPRLRAGTDSVWDLTAVGSQGQGSHGSVCAQDISHTGEWAIRTVVAMNMSDPY